MEQVVHETVRYSGVCQECGGVSENRGVQALVGDRLRWDVESACSACGSAVADCGGDLPDELRERMLAEHGAVRLVVREPAGRGVAVMRVLRAESGIDLVGARALARRVLGGEHSGTLPEVERLARRLREAGVPAAAVRP